MSQNGHFRAFTLFCRGFDFVAISVFFCVNLLGQKLWLRKFVDKYHVWIIRAIRVTRWTRVGQVWWDIFIGVFLVGNFGREKFCVLFKLKLFCDNFYISDNKVTIMDTISCHKKIICYWGISGLRWMVDNPICPTHSFERCHLHLW